jgi:uncharacterized protein YbaP (TraB family)
MKPSRAYASRDASAKTALRQRGRRFVAGRLRLAVAALLLAVCAAAALAQAPADARKDAPRRGLLYEVKSGANVGYLFGTLHVGKPEFYPLDAQTNGALAASDRLYLEVNLTDADAVTRATEATMYTGAATLADKLPPALMEKVRARLERYQFPQEAALRMKPWMLAHTLLLLEAKRRGYDPELASEFFLLGNAAATGKEIRGLETLADQFAIFDGLSPGEQQAFLEETLAEVDDSGFEARLKALADAWANGDAGALEEALRAERARDSIYADALLPRLIDQRNRTMADKIAEIVRAGSKSFVAIGALHLVGRDGVVELLRRRGFAVRQL